MDLVTGKSRFALLVFSDGIEKESTRLWKGGERAKGREQGQPEALKLHYGRMEVQRKTSVRGWADGGRCSSRMTGWPMRCSIEIVSCCTDNVLKESLPIPLKTRKQNIGSRNTLT